MRYFNVDEKIDLLLVLAVIQCQLLVVLAVLLRRMNKAVDGAYVK